MHTCNFLGSKKTTAVSQKNSLVPWNCEFCYSCVFAALRWFGNNSVPTLQETTGCLMGERCEYCARASRLNVANTLEKLDLRFVSYCRLASLHLKIIWSIQMPSYACPIETACFVLFCFFPGETAIFANETARFHVFVWSTCFSWSTLLCSYLLISYYNINMCFNDWEGWWWWW